MPQSIDIPATLDDAKSSLAGIRRVLGVKRWERAAIIYAFTTNESGGGAGTHAANKPTVAKVQQLGIREAADELDMAAHTVIKYRRLWEQHGDPSIKPGDSVTLPDVEWPKQEGGRTTGSAANAEAAIAAAMNNPAQRQAAAEIVVEQVASDPHLLRDALRNAGPTAIVAADDAVKDFAAASAAKAQARKASKKPNDTEALAEIVNEAQAAIMHLTRLRDYLNSTELSPANEQLLTERVAKVEMLVADIKLSTGGMTQAGIDAWLQGVTE